MCVSVFVCECVRVCVWGVTTFIVFVRLSPPATLSAVHTARYWTAWLISCLCHHSSISTVMQIFLGWPCLKLHRWFPSRSKATGANFLQEPIQEYAMDNWCVGSGKTQRYLSKNVPYCLKFFRGGLLQLRALVTTVYLYLYSYSE